MELCALTGTLILDEDGLYERKTLLRLLVKRVHLDGVSEKSYLA